VHDDLLFLILSNLRARRVKKDRRKLPPDAPGWMLSAGGPAPMLIVCLTVCLLALWLLARLPFPHPFHSLLLALGAGGRRAGAQIQTSQ
jgi:hypothetical protein